MKEKPFITASIKTFNEEEGVAKTIQSIRKQIGDYPHKIVVADSLSTDATQSIALKNGAEVVSLTNEEDRCCGVGHQLGYLYSEGDYLLLLDGDMELEDGFIDAGIAFLEANKEYAGVAGMVEMDDANSYEFKSRKQRIHQIYPVGDNHHLAGGGLYRKSAIDEVGYLTNRNLHAYEEAELGIRLHKAGYKLHRLDVPYFFHTSYTMSSVELLKYRWKSRYLFACGELLRGALGTDHFTDVLKVVKNEAIFTLYLLGLVMALLTFNPVIAGVTLLPLIAFMLLKSIKNRSFKDAIQSVINLSFFSAGMIRGFLRPVKDPCERPDCKVIENRSR